MLIFRVGDSNNKDISVLQNLCSPICFNGINIKLLIFVINLNDVSVSNVFSTFFFVFKYNVLMFSINEIYI